MADDLQNVPTEKPHSKGFDYCFWSKLLVAIVLFPIVAFVVSSFFSHVIFKVMAAVIAIGAFIYTARWLDRLPCFASMIPPLIGRKR